MPNCPNCNDHVPTEAQYCPSCGESVAASCPECGADVRQGANFCPDCGSDLSTTDRGMSPDEGRSSSHDWRLAGNEFAKRLGPGASGADSKLEWLRGHENVRIETGNTALLLQDGEIVETLEPGKHTLDTFVSKITRLGDSKHYEVVVVEDSGTSVTIHLENLRTADDSLVNVDLELSVRVDDQERFYESMMGNREVVTGRTFQEAFAGPIRDEIEAQVQEHEREELYGNRQIKGELQAGLEGALEDILAGKGMSLTALRSFDYSDGREEIREEREAVDVEREREDVREDRVEVEQERREREVDDHIHEQRQEARAEAGEEIAEASARHEAETTKEELEHEAEMQAKEHAHEEIDKEHDIEEDEVVHEEDLRTTRTEAEVERRDVEHEQDVKEMSDLMDIKKEKDRHSLDVEERESEIEMRKDEHEVELEKEKLQARDEVDAATLASLAETDEGMSEIAKLQEAGELDLSPEQLDALGARESDELAKARQEAKKAESERERVEDQKEFREEIKDMAEQSMDRMQDTTDTAMDNMGGAAEAAAEDTSDNVIVSGSGDSGSSGDTTIVQGGGGGGGQARDDEPGGQADPGGGGDAVACPDCGAEVDAGNAFCTSCGHELD